MRTSPTDRIAYSSIVHRIGDTSLLGGTGDVSGGVFGTVIGALIIGTLTAGAQQADWKKWEQEVAIGCIIIVAVALDQLRNLKRT